MAYLLRKRPIEQLNEQIVRDGKTKALVKRKYQSDDEEAENLQNVKNLGMAKKRSMLPKGNFSINFLKHI